MLGGASWGGGRGGGLSIWIRLGSNQEKCEQQVAAHSDKDGERMLLAGSVGIKGAAVSHKNRGIWNGLQSLKMWTLPSQPVG